MVLTFSYLIYPVSLKELHKVSQLVTCKDSFILFFDRFFCFNQVREEEGRLSQ